MSIPKSPFAASSTLPGTGDIVLSLLPPGKQVLTSFTYQYPLKLIAPDPHHGRDNKHVTIVFLLTYGGGLVGGDKINLRVELEALTRLILVTQGSTKLFKSPNRSTVSGQTLDVKIGAGSALCYLPDPTQPFAESLYEQKQTFYVDANGSSSLLMLDWVSEGRRARGESWSFWGWKGRNEVREFDPSFKGRLLLRDAVILNDGMISGSGLVEKTNELGIFGTLIIYGPMFEQLGQAFMDKFSNQPRIGEKSWSQGSKQHPENVNGDIHHNHAQERRWEEEDGLLWTAAKVRGFVLVKFGAKNLDGAKAWLRTLLQHEPTVEANFGHQALICLR